MAYLALTESGMGPIESLTWESLGTLSSSYSSTTASKEITSRFATEIAAGQRSFLYQFAGQNGADNSYAEFICSSASLVVKDLVP